MHLAWTVSFKACHLIRQEKQIISNENNMIKNPNWKEADQLAIYKARRIWIRATEDKSIKRQGRGIKPGTSGLEVQRPNH